MLPIRAGKARQWPFRERQQRPYSPKECEPLRQRMPKLGQIKLKQVQQLNTADSAFLVRKHKEVLNWMMRTFALDTYALTWAQFFKGFGLGALAVWLLMR